MQTMREGKGYKEMRTPEMWEGALPDVDVQNGF